MDMEFRQLEYSEDYEDRPDVVMSRPRDMEFMPSDNSKDDENRQDVDISQSIDMTNMPSESNISDAESAFDSDDDEEMDPDVRSDDESTNESIVRFFHSFIFVVPQPFQQKNSILSIIFYSLALLEI